MPPGQAAAPGPGDQSSFARRFKAHYGLSATTYRKRFATGATQPHRPGTLPWPAWPVTEAAS